MKKELKIKLAFLPVKGPGALKASTRPAAVTHLARVLNVNLLKCFLN